MAANPHLLKARRDALVERCSDQRMQLAQDVAALSSPDTFGVVPAVLYRHRKTALVAAGVAAGLFVVRPAWAVGIATGAVSAYQLVMRLLPVLRWKGLEVH